jgi:hypothetical protein
MPKTNFSKVQQTIGSWPEPALRNSAQAVATDFQELKASISRAVNETAGTADGFRLLFLHDLLTAYAGAIRRYIDSAPKVTATEIEQVEIDRPGEQTLRAQKKVTREI